ncbi:hypothetical protein D3C73_1114700 [compost metagenome]
MIVSASAAASRRLRRLSSTARSRSSTVYRNASLSVATSASMSRGTARSNSSIGLCRRARRALATAARWITGSRAAVAENTTSASARWRSSSVSGSATPPWRLASSCACARVRLAISRRRTLPSLRWRAASSMVSPAPTSSTVESSRRANAFCARRTAAEATDTGLAPTWVSVRARLATENVCWNSRSRRWPSRPWSRAVDQASFTWPRICGSPSTIESSPVATRNRWRTASASACWYR